jgi:hypothetical protein
MADRIYTPAQIAAKADTAFLRTAKVLADLAQMSDEDFRAVDAQLAGGAVETVRDWALQYLARRDPEEFDSWFYNLDIDALREKHLFQQRESQ